VAGTRRRTARSALTETLRRGRSASRAGVGPPLAGATLEPQMYPPVYAERMRRWEVKFNLHPHDRLILEVRGLRPGEWENACSGSHTDRRGLWGIVANNSTLPR